MGVQAGPAAGRPEPAGLGEQPAGMEKPAADPKAAADNVTDGKQTPMKGHPVFIAQHATGTCCRGSLGKWHHIGRNRIMSDTDVKYVVDVIMTWIGKEYSNYKKNHLS